MQSYLFLASLSLGGAEKIVVEHLALNTFGKTTLIILHNKEREYSIPKGVNLLRLNGKITRGAALFQQMTFENKTLIAHLITDQALDYLFSFNVTVSLVFHNDQVGWKNTPTYFNHPNIVLLIVVSQHIKAQLKPLTQKPIVVIKHHLSLPEKQRTRNIRQALKLDKHTKIIGMVGRIAPQKDYLYALKLLKNTPYTLIIVGGYEKIHYHYYCQMIKKIVAYNLQKRVFLVGFRENVHDYMAVFDAGLNCSIYEGISIATQEMLAYHIPVYVADNLGQKEILDVEGNLHFFNKQKQDVTFSFDQCEDAKGITNPSLREKIFKQSLSQWNLLGHIKPYTAQANTLFITQNLGLGGAQRSLTNLLLQLKQPLVVLNRSNYTGFIAALYEQHIAVRYLDKRDLFALCALLFQHIAPYQKIIFWNLDPKVKLLLTSTVKSYHSFNQLNSKRNLQTLS